MAWRNFKVLPKNLNASSSDTYPLSPEQVQFYNENGYLIMRKLFAQPILNTYRERFIDVCNGRVDKEILTVVKDRALCKLDSKPEEYINKIQELLYDEVYSTYSEDPRLMHIVSQLIGENLTAINNMLINKPPGTGPHPPHQDLLYFPFRPGNKIVGTWTAIDPVRKENGCLYMIPGSHKQEDLYEHSDQIHEAKQFFYGVVDWKTLAPEHKRVDLEMEPGDTVIFPSTLVHGSRANNTQTYRKAITCHYANSNCEYIQVAGTHHEPLARDMERELRRRGSDLNYVPKDVHCWTKALLKISTTHGPGPLLSIDYWQPLLSRRSILSEACPHCVFRFMVATPEPFCPISHRFCELCALPIAT